MARFGTSGSRIALMAVLGLITGTHPLPAQGSYRPTQGRMVVIRPPFEPQDVPDRAVLDQIQNIVRDRPPQAEAAARAFLSNIARERVGEGEGPITVPVLDRLKATNPDAYWREIAQLVTQFEMFQNVFLRDSVRARSMAAMFGTEFEARVLQRAWRDASEAERRTMRGQLEALMTRHFEAEDQLRALEMQDIERRLADARAESERRRQRRAELVRWSVDDIILQAVRPD
jgi:hypothetical protein